jgi:uncharacterized membrane protein
MKKVFWVVTVMLAILVGYIPISYLINGVAEGYLELKKPEVLRSQTWWIFLYVHMIFGGLAILIGWTQFSKRIQNNYKVWHRKIGKVYVIASLICAISGFYIGFFATGGWLPAIGFILVACIYFYTTLMGFLSIKRRQITLHQNLMTYSYACCLSAVSLRLWVPISYIFTDNYILSYTIIAWMAWIPNLGVAYWVNRSRVIE